MTIILPGMVQIYGDPTGSLRIHRGRGGAIPDLVFYTTSVAPTTFDPSLTKALGAAVIWSLGDGSPNQQTNSLSYTYASAGTKTVQMYSPDVTMFRITAFDISADGCFGALPSFAACTALVFFYCYSNKFSGTLPSFAACTALVDFRCLENKFSGALPSFAACTALVDFRCRTNQFSGALPSFAACTALTNFQCYDNQFSDYAAGGFATQKSLADVNFSLNALIQSAVDGILADCVTSLGIPGRVVCTLNLQGGTNATPSAAGLADKATLIAAGWTVTTN